MEPTNVVISDSRCSVCGSEVMNTQTLLHDDRYGYPGLFELLKCIDCGHMFLKVEFSSEQLQGLYSNYYPRRNFDVDNYKLHSETSGFGAWFNGLHSSVFRWVPKNVRVLDVGCGFGQSLGYHAARGCDVYGVEADENIRRVIDKFGFKVHVGLFDEQVYESNFFDYLTMDQVIEHVTDPLSTLRGVAQVLKPGGFAIFSTPNANGWGANIFGKRWINWHSPYHLQFFSLRSIKLAAEQSGMELVKVRTVTNSDWLLYQWLHLATYPKLGETSKFWLQSKLEPTLLQKIGVRLLAVTHRTKINHVITRLFDGLGIGDNFVFVLKKL